jgi:hypothetical protein
MREVSRNFLIIVLILVNSICCFSQNNVWNGLIPLRSTRSQVEKLLGEPKEKTVFGTFIYESKDGQVEISYSDKKCDLAWDVPVDTVLRLELYPVSLAGKSFEELKIDKNSFSVSVDDAFYAKWTNPEEGLQYYFSGGDKELISISFLPKKSDNNLRCNGFPPFAPEGQHFTFERSLFYNPALEKKESLYENFARAQAFLVNLSNTGDKNKYKGYVLVYFDNKLPFKDYRKRLDKLRERIFKTWKADPEQITIIEGGMREESLIEFYILPKEWKPPAPTPALPSPQFMRKQ